MGAYDSGYFGAKVADPESLLSSKPYRVDSEVQKLVQAMASFAPPAVGETVLRVNQQDNLTTLAVTSWQ